MSSTYSQKHPAFILIVFKNIWTEGNYIQISKGDNPLKKQVLARNQVLKFWESVKLINLQTSETQCKLIFVPTSKSKEGRELSECVNMVARETFPDRRENLTGIYMGPRKQCNLIFLCSLSGRERKQCRNCEYR